MGDFSIISKRIKKVKDDFNKKTLIKLNDNSTWVYLETGEVAYVYPSKKLGKESLENDLKGNYILYQQIGSGLLNEEKIFCIGKIFELKDNLNDLGINRGVKLTGDFYVFGYNHYDYIIKSKQTYWYLVESDLDYLTIIPEEIVLELISSDKSPKEIFSILSDSNQLDY